jgi:hypothetical protein
LLTVLMIAGAFAWDHPRSDGTNRGFADVFTKPAGAGSLSIPNIGTFAPGAGPVTGPDGTVYIGNEQGKLWAFHADGKPYWSRDIARGQSIVASPAVDSHGNVYVIGVRSVTDNRVSPPVKRQESTLHKFTSSGGWLYQAPLPAHGNGGATTAAPNVWKYEGDEAIMIPIAYPNPLTGGYETRLIAMSPEGQVIGDTRIDVLVPTVTGGSDYPAWQVGLCMVPPFLACLTPVGFTVPGGHQVIQPMPTAAIYRYPNGGTPFIIVADGFQSFVGFQFSSGTFYEVFRERDDRAFRTMISTPMVLPNGQTVIGTTSGMRYLGPNKDPTWPTFTDVHSYGAATWMPDGRVAVVTGANDLAILWGTAVQQRIPLGSAAIASAAASRNQLFVSTADALFTFDTHTLQQVGRFDWVGGGISPPAIGSKGQVYAMASNILFVFPGTIQVPKDVSSTAQPQGGVVAIDPAQQPPQQASHLYHPPLTANGNRLFACEELDQDGCGPGDYQTISRAFCQKEGFAQADHLDVDSRKVKAETLDGHFCSRSKCKVFDTINCHM